MKRTTKNDNKTIYQNLGLSSEWEQENINELMHLIENNDSFVEVIKKRIGNIKKEEFNVDNEDITLTDYEKKLFYSGMELSRIMILITNEIIQEKGNNEIKTRKRKK